MESEILIGRETGRSDNGGPFPGRPFLIAGGTTIQILFLGVERPPMQPITGERPVIPPNNGVTVEFTRFGNNQDAPVSTVVESTKMRRQPLRQGASIFFVIFEKDDLHFTRRRRADLFQQTRR